MGKLWGGRFSKSTDKLVEDFHSSISFDKRLYYFDITGSIAHARMLGDTGIIPKQDADLIIKGLKEIITEIENGQVEFDVSAEDIHMNVEVLLTKKIGQVGKKLHTGRSRNDQVALDAKMYLKTEIEILAEMFKELLNTVLDLSSGHLDTVMPGYTHLQRAQPVTFAHHLMAYFQMFSRDLDRLRDCGKRVNILPLGAGALAGTTFPINREQVSEELGFSSITLNSMDSVSDRDYVIEFISCASMAMMHLSRFCEEIIFWSSQEVRFIELDDAYSTGSSIMPQKKNPDVAELIRGKTGRVYGNLMTMLTVMKGIPLAYNKDMQEDKESLFDSIDTLKKCLIVFTPMIATMKINRANMLNAAKGGFTNATDLADYLVKKGLPFRDAHEVSGKLVAYCISISSDLDSIPLEKYKEFSDLIEDDIYEAISVYTCVEKRNVIGGPAPDQVRYSILKGKEYLANN
ncbi:argininosuccinate lyase [Desulfonispora thiosulfatigenes DSM 11270]|uniref:Argininosuccinate lyase n=1 Tax=Desulfonispora thiosulfatigenes DSM 11270 TaxID=656914 RepID=A0A1W1VCG1_DESTI|nr:argininosuccinate lyase [Desulfonispora thiosulfatigenes]SMB91147.1 argininosuccinate lyase [Desulfonispora thiosulfatigenes DSM 11270]